MCFLFPLRSNADPFECPDTAGLTPHYQRYASTTNPSDCQSGVPPPRLCPACRQLLAESDWLSQVPASTARSPATDSDPGTFQHAHHVAYLFSGFREMKPLAFVLQEIFRGSIPSLALWLTSSFAPASCKPLPSCMRSSVLNWWLSFIQAGLSSLLMPASPGALICFSCLRRKSIISFSANRNYLLTHTLVISPNTNFR
jgi:hypothetical protein